MQDVAQHTCFYQIQIFWKGKIEIFQNAFKHSIIIKKGKVVGIDIQYSKTKNTGNCTVSRRNLRMMYDIKYLDNPKYESKTSVPIGTVLTIH